MIRRLVKVVIIIIIAVGLLAIVVSRVLLRSFSSDDNSPRSSPETPAGKRPSMSLAQVFLKTKGGN